MGIRKSQMFGSDCLLDASSSTSFDASLVTWFTPLFICCKRYIALYKNVYKHSNKPSGGIIVTPAGHSLSNLRTRPAFSFQLHTCQVSRLRLQRLQRCRANEILLTQQNREPYCSQHARSQIFRTTFWFVDTQRQ